MGTIRRLTEEKELRLAGASVGTKVELEARGLTYMGSLGEAAQCGYFTPRACERLGQPVCSSELEQATHFAMMADCSMDICITTPGGKRVRPCIPVFFRQAGGSVLPV